ncbi:hypothetical protein [Streptomyces silvisoli]|uniref:Uncharacterized protein n=1 Tax=Streptomyces silvisoli TaxID=3034235 RepID=A0ABT5ZTW9_9ACTN|nr:hypothetical protein [Streptomyces silvisoli]MDF3293277.1 hypothetical protein [Streptomyces silvisoli]
MAQKVTKHLSNWAIVKGVDQALAKALWQSLTQDFVDCSHGNLSGCAWAASWFVPQSTILDTTRLVRSLQEALRTGIGVSEALEAAKAAKLEGPILAKLEQLLKDAQESNIHFPDPKRAYLGTDGKYHIHEGDWSTRIDRPTDLSDTITDIDLVKDGVLWEEKTAVNPIRNIDKWVGIQVGKKLRKYIDARQYIAGYESAPIGIVFTDPAVNAANPACALQWNGKYRNSGASIPTSTFV